MTEQQQIQAAQSAIAKILCQLEADTGLLVTDLGLERIEVTTLRDPAPRHMVRPVITVERRPAHDWSY